MDTETTLVAFSSDERPARPARPGDTCPQCGHGRLDYNSVLMLACEICGYAFAEGGGCT